MNENVSGCFCLNTV